MNNIGSFTLSNGTEIPAIGFGTWQIPDGEIAYSATAEALKAGYRHIDTALAYGNEKSVGRAIRDSGIERSGIFVTSKLPAEVKDYDLAVASFEKTMKNIGLDYIDLYLIHAPWPWNQIGKDCTKENIIIWKAMEEFYRSGRTKAIGISNFTVRDAGAILDNSTVRPMVNQIKLHIGYPQEEIMDFCRRNNILVEGYSPLATGRILQNEELTRLAGKYGRSPAQLSVRYVLQKGALPLPKSVHPGFIRQNLDIDFVITDDDIRMLDALK